MGVRTAFAVAAQRYSRIDRSGPVRVEKGFTIIELVVTVAILAILTAWGLPSLRRFVLDNSISNTKSELLASLNYARAQAIAQHTTVMLCKTANPTATTPSCDTTSTAGYEEGWVVCTAASSTATTCTTTLKSVSAPTKMSSSITVRADNGLSSQVFFSSRGFVSNLSGTNVVAYMVVCDSRQWKYSGQFARVITVQNTGSAIALNGNDSRQTVVTSCTPP